MECRAVVPKIIFTRLESSVRDVTGNPTHVFRRLSQTAPRELQGDGRNIEDRHTRESPKKQVIDQRGCATTGIEDRGGAIHGCALDPGEGRFEMRAVPAQGVRSLGGVNFFPVTCCVHAVGL